jgi:hypothetical protein
VVDLVSALREVQDVDHVQRGHSAGISTPCEEIGLQARKCGARIASNSQQATQQQRWEHTGE